MIAAPITKTSTSDTRLLQKASRRRSEPPIYEPSGSQRGRVFVGGAVGD